MGVRDRKTCTGIVHKAHAEGCSIAARERDPEGNETQKYWWRRAGTVDGSYFCGAAGAELCVGNDPGPIANSMFLISSTLPMFTTAMTSSQGSG